MRLFASLMIILLWGLLVKPLLPYFEYTMNKASIVEKHCENVNTPNLECEGSCYLQKQLKKASNYEKELKVIPEGMEIFFGMFLDINEIQWITIKEHSLSSQYLACYDFLFVNQNLDPPQTLKP
ncbi:MAG: hypothetical protein MRY83_07910 [Flavobacteriales bacterium]|nr:hypothetical protein [Flavobacteriales bacterium]